MKNPLSLTAKIAIALLLLMGCANIVLAYYSLIAPLDKSEFAALHNFAIGIYAILIALFSVIILFSAVFMIKQKRWAYFLSIIFTILTIPVLEVSNLKEIAFNLSLGSNISLNKEILPIIILILLLLCRKDFRKSKNNSPVQ